MPNNATGMEAEAVPMGQPFTGIPNATGDASGYFFIYNLTPNTVYNWKARATCVGGGHSNWSQVYSFTTPAPCPAPPLAPLDSVITLTFPTGPNPNVGYDVCGIETALSNGNYLWGFKAANSGLFRFRVVSNTGSIYVDQSLSTGPHPECRGISYCIGFNIQPGFTYDFALSAGEAIYWGFRFSPVGTSDGTSSFVIEKRECPTPSGLGVDHVTGSTATLRISSGMPVDIELAGENDVFTGQPGFTHVKDSVMITGLQPGLGYKWQLRGNCQPYGIGAWQPGLNFETPGDCANTPVIKCDSTYQFHFKAGVGYYNTGEYAEDGREILLRYRPERSDIMVATIDRPALEYREVFLAWRDSASIDCTLGPWPNYRLFGEVPRTIPLGYVDAGHTYYLLLEHSDYDTLTVSINIHCPALCPAPVFLTLLDTQQTQVTLHWKNNDQMNQFQVELRALTDTFAGIPTHFGTGDTLVVTGLQGFTKYHWRVRSLCNGVPGPWSAAIDFITLPFCYKGPILPCDQPTLVNTASGIDYITSCYINNSNEQYFRFIPPYEGNFTISVLSTGNIEDHFAYFIKPATLDCSNYGWKCLGYIYSIDKLQTGFLEGGKTYLLAVKRPNGGSSDYAQEFVIQCPAACLVADGLNVSTGLPGGKAKLNWNKKGNEQHWDIELVEENQAFSGFPNFGSDTIGLTLNNLPPGLYYHWRIRNNCGSFGVTDWSAPVSFFMPPYCASIACGETDTLISYAGKGYFAYLDPCGSGMPLGQDLMKSFTVDSGNTTRYLIFPPGSHAEHFAFYLRNSNATECINTFVYWNCLGDASVSQVFFMNNLTPGATYYLLIKKFLDTGTDTLQFQFACSITCDTIKNSRTEIPGFQTINAIWETTYGPWSHEVDIHDPSGAPAGNFIFGPEVKAYNIFYNLQPGNQDIFEWRVRRRCWNGDSSAWSATHRFRLPYNCPQVPKLNCFEPHTLTSTPADAYTYLRACGGWGDGKFSFYVLNLPYDTASVFGIQVLQASGGPITYALSSGNEPNCQQEPRPWPSCQSTSTTGTLSLGTLTPGKTYYLQVYNENPESAAQTFQLVCTCKAPLSGYGVQQLDGSIDLNWSGVAGVDHTELEVIPAGSSFSGTPNYSSTQMPYSITGLDQAVDYQFRVRTVCTSALTGNWSAIFPIYRITDCAHPIKATCGQIINLYAAAGAGEIDLNFCGHPCPGKEIYLEVSPTLSGDYYFTSVSESGNGTLVIAPLPACGDTLPSFDCTLGVGQGIGYYIQLLSGETYRFLVDNQNLQSGFKQVILNCPGDQQPTNDEPFGGGIPPLYYYQSPTLEVNGDCKLFTNRKATHGSLDPNPSVLPGNWYDGTEHSVWFQFTAPPGGTVQVNVQSDDADPFDPQVALVHLDSSTVWTFKVLATGEDQVGPHPKDAAFNYSGLTPGSTCFLIVDGVNGSVGRFCIGIKDEPMLSNTIGTCETFTQPQPPLGDPEAWRNLYATNDLHINGPLLAAIKSNENLGTITISSEILPNTPVLPNGQKILPRYFSINPQYQPQNPVQLRLFFTSEDLAAFNLTPPITTAAPFDLGITHYDGSAEDCDPTNNSYVSGSIPVQPASAILMGDNGLFYLETTVAGFSEFGASPNLSSSTHHVDAEILNLQVFPNPAVETIEIVLETPSPAVINLSISNMTGQVIWKDAWDHPSGEMSRQVSLKDLPVGVYLLTVRQEGYGFGRRMVVKM
jgi:hypothetical protein